MLYTQLKTDFKKNGGWKSKKNLFIIFLFLWGVYTVLKNYGWLPKKSVKGKHVFITGAGSGLGREMAIRFARLGAKVTLTDIFEAGLKESHDLVRKSASTTKISYFVLDVSNRDQISEVAKQAMDVNGPVDILINNAGVYSKG